VPCTTPLPLGSPSIRRITLQNVGPIRQADVSFGDLTVFVGPQATGKSILLQLVKLELDWAAIHAELRRFNIDWSAKKPGDFIDIYLGSGMRGIWSEQSTLAIDGELRNWTEYARTTKRNKNATLFFIPAQRVMSLLEGRTRTFTEYRSGDPFVLRDFSEKLHNLVQNEFGNNPNLFPQDRRLNRSLRAPLEEHVFAGFGLKIDLESFQKRMVLASPTGGGRLPYLVWSAGQREFVPLLLGLYWLLPPSQAPLRDKLRWVVIEELEMGLHPNAITATMALVLELVSRGYKVCLSTHSPHVLDVIWALQFFKDNAGHVKDVLKIFELASNPSTKKLASAALRKVFKVYFFRRGGEVLDISKLDPGSDSPQEAGWGGLSEFSGRVADVVAEVARRKEAQPRSQDT
jgi:hypothetical protein